MASTKDNLTLDDDDQEWFAEFDAPSSDPQLLPSFTIGLSLTGDDGSSMRTENDPNDPLQRDNYIEQKGAIDIRCSSIDVVHGLYSPTEFATLIILDFRFDSRKRARRISFAKITLQFAGMKPGDAEPEVAQIAPFGTLHLVPTEHVEAVTTKGELSVGASAVATATGTIGWEKSVSKSLTAQTTVTGSIDLLGRNYGKKNAACWTLKENPTTKTGVPVYMRAAVLLKRRDERPFKCLPEISATADFKSSLERIFGSQPKNDPVLFDPELPPTNNLEAYDLEKLGVYDLEAASDLTFSTVLTTASKVKALKSTS